MDAEFESVNEGEMTSRLKPPVKLSQREALEIIKNAASRHLSILSNMDALELVKYAIDDQMSEKHLSFKEVIGEFKKRPPSKIAAEAVIDAYRQGDAPPWLAAVLLGECRDKAGYATAREILLSAPGQLAESYAGVALARIGGVEAFEDLKTLMISAEKIRSREGAAHGLGAMASRAAAAPILQAVLAGKIRWNKVAGTLVRQLDDEAMVVRLIRSNDKQQIRLGTEIINGCVLIDASRTSSGSTCPLIARPGIGLLEAIREVLSNPDITMSPCKRDTLRSWLGNFAGAKESCGN